MRVFRYLIRVKERSSSERCVTGERDMKYQIKPMAASDYDAVAALWRNSEGIGLDDDCDSHDGVRRYLERNPNLSFVACDGEKIIGAVLCGHDGRRGYLHHLAVEKAYRGQGMGKALVNKCIEALAKQRIAKCNIFLYHDNETGRSFWEHNGWVPREDLAVLQRPTA